MKNERQPILRVISKSFLFVSISYAFCFSSRVERWLSSDENSALYLLNSRSLSSLTGIQENIKAINKNLNCGTKNLRIYSFYFAILFSAIAKIKSVIVIVESAAVVCEWLLVRNQRRFGRRR